MAGSDTDVALLVHRGVSDGSVSSRPHNGSSDSGQHKRQSDSRNAAGSNRSSRRRPLSLFTVLLLLLVCGFAVLAAVQLLGGGYFCQLSGYHSDDAAAGAVPHRSPHRRSPFSEYNCLAGHSVPGIEGIRDATAHSRMCWFGNVCINRDRQLLFYSDPELPAEPIRVDRSIHTSFPSHLVNLRRYMASGSQAFYTVQVVRSAIPSHAVWSASSVHALYHQFWPENFGHVLGDDVYPVYQQLRRFGLIASRDVQVLGWLPCSYSGRDNTSRQRACENTHDLFHTIADQPWLHLDDFLAAHTNTTDESALVCLDQVVMGHGLNGMYWQGRDWPLFIEHINQQLPSDTQHTRPQRLSLLITRKTNRRKVVNFDELVDYLQRVFDMPVDVWEPDKLSFDEQVRTARQYAVLVTPCGGISFVSPFLYPGSSVVYVDWFDSSWNTTSYMEEYVWQHDPRLTRFHYQIKRADITGVDYDAMQRDGVSAADTDLKLAWRNYPLLHIEPSRMAYFVMHALRRAASRLDLADTLNYTRILHATDHFDQLDLHDDTPVSDNHTLQVADKVWEDDAEAAARREDATIDTSGDKGVERVAQLTVSTKKASQSAAHCGIPIYYWSPGKGRENFGDALGVVLLRLITRFDPRVRFTNLASRSPKLTSIGSIADTARAGDWVWSSGVHPWAHNSLSERRAEAESFYERYESINVCALRGPRSSQFFVEATNQSLSVPEVYGDGALLLPLYFTGLREEALALQSQQANLTNLVLIIPHLRDYDAVRKKLGKERGSWSGLNYQLVWVLDPWQSVLRAIVRSSLVVASSLHGIIVAESFGVGARLFRTKSSDGAFKYSDYYEGTGRYGVNLTHTLDEALRLGPEAPIGVEKLKSIQRGLLSSFPKQLWDDCPIPVMFNMPAT